MKKNIFAANLPVDVNLSFALIKFMREPKKNDVRYIDDLPTMVLNFIDDNTAEIHPFYIKVERKQVSARDYDDLRVGELVRIHVHGAVREFGRCNGDLSLSPHYTDLQYEHTPGGERKLRPSAEENFFNGLAVQARPIEERLYFRQSLFELSFGGKVNTFTMQLTDALRFTAYSDGAVNQIYSPENNPSIITGTAKLLGKRAQIRVEAEPRHQAIGSILPIRNWLTHGVLHAAVQERLGSLIGESFGPLADDLIDRLIDDIAFNLN